MVEFRVAVVKESCRSTALSKIVALVAETSPWVLGVGLSALLSVDSTPTVLS